MKHIQMLLMAACTIMSVTLFAQTKGGRIDTVKHQQLYTCPMHNSVAATKPGNCSICGMKLQLSKKEEAKMMNTKNYSCPTHLEVVSDKPGKCSVCGSKLQANLSPKEKGKYESMKLLSCPMHPDQKSAKAGKCKICGMTLTAK
jgi:hypothetical protein